MKEIVLHNELDIWVVIRDLTDLSEGETNEELDEWESDGEWEYDEGLEDGDVDINNPLSDDIEFARNVDRTAKLLG